MLCYCQATMEFMGIGLELPCIGIVVIKLKIHNCINMSKPHSPLP